MIVVVHSFVADSRLLDCCDLVVCVLVVFFSFFFSFFLPPYACQVWDFEVVSAVLFLSLCQLFACLIRAAIFRLPPAFVVWSFFLSHRHLCGLFFLSLP